MSPDLRRRRIGSDEELVSSVAVIAPRQQTSVYRRLHRLVERNALAALHNSNGRGAVGFVGDHVARPVRNQRDLPRGQKHFLFRSDEPRRSAVDSDHGQWSAVVDVDRPRCAHGQPQ